MRVLVVEDEMVIREILKVFLSQFFQVEACESVSEAICHLDKQDFDIIITDLQLGDLTGLDLIGVLKKTQDIWQRMPNLKIVLMSGSFVKNKRLPADIYFLAKPFNLEEIKQFIEKEAQ